MKPFFRLAVIIITAFLLSSSTCTMKIVKGQDYHTQPVAQGFESGKEDVFNAIKAGMKLFGYQVHYENLEDGKIVAKWRSVESDSHYYPFFGRKDYGVSDGAYYQLHANISPEGSKYRVAVSTTVKTIVGRLESTGKVEKRLIEQMKNLLMAPQIDLTNVGVEKKNSDKLLELE